jgi:hypothetical protein
VIKIHYYEDVPREVRGAVDPLICEYLCVLPDWVQHLRVYYQTEAGSCYIRVEYRYRELKLTVAPGFLVGDEAFRRNCILHEFAHAYTSPPCDSATASLRHALGEDSPAFKIAEDALDLSSESMTEDLATLFKRLLDRC